MAGSVSFRIENISIVNESFKGKIYIEKQFLSKLAKTEVNDEMQRKQWQREKVSYPRVANSVESSVMDEKLSFQSPTHPGSANVRTGEGVGYELNFVSHFEAFHKI